MMFHGKVPQHLWVEAFFSAMFLINLLHSSVLQDNKSPYEMIHQKPPTYTALRVFGCKCYPSLRPYMQNKFDPKSLSCVFLGYNEKYKGYRCLYPPTGKIFISRHVLFDENSFPLGDIYSDHHKEISSPLINAWRDASLHRQTSVTPSTPHEEVIPPRCRPHMEVQDPVLPEPVAQEAIIPPPPIPSPVVSESESEDNIIDDPQLHDEIQQPVHQMTTRARAGIIKPNPKYALFTVKDVDAEPKSVRSALKHPGWTKAMGTEVDNMVETETFELVPPAENQNPLGCGWVYKKKINVDGTVRCLRARLVAKGNQQEQGVDFLETFSPVVRTATIRTVLHVAVTKHWSLRQLDVQNAFLHGDLKETVYMKQPPGFEDLERPDYVWHLKKAIYGLKQAPRAWFDKFSDFLLAFGFQCSFPDPSLFIYHKGSDVIYLLLYVDDMILTGNNEDLLNTLLLQLGKQFRMKDMGPLHYFLGILVHHYADGMFLNQEKYAADLLITAGMRDCAPMPTPLPMKLEKVPDQDVLFSDPSLFRSLAGKLQYLTLTRPDI